MVIKLRLMWSLLTSVCLSTATLAASMPHAEFNGVWRVIGHTTALLTSEGNEPPLLPAAKAIYDQHRQAYKQGDKKFDQMLQCQPPGVPRLMFDAMPFEVMVQTHQVVLMHQWNRLVRWVDIDKAHSEPLGPTFLGQSVGRWDGNTLEIDTNGFNDSTLLDAQGLPHSDQMHVIERYALSSNRQRIDAIIRIEDPQTFVTPWQTKVSFERKKNLRIAEDICVERLNLDQYK